MRGSLPYERDEPESIGIAHTYCADGLPGPLRLDTVAHAFANVGDRLLEPIIMSIGSFDAYLDPRLAPDDFLVWLAHWVAIDVDEGLPDPQRRALVASAVAMHRRRGTVSGLKEIVKAVFGREPTIEEPGGCAWSAAAGATAPGHGGGEVVVRLDVEAAGCVDPTKFHELVRRLVPAHLTLRTEVTHP